MKLEPVFATALMISCAGQILAQSITRFTSTGPVAPVAMNPDQPGVVGIHFDLLPTSMRLNAPADPCLVTENVAKEFKISLNAVLIAQARVLSSVRHAAAVLIESSSKISGPS